MQQQGGGGSRQEGRETMDKYTVVGFYKVTLENGEVVFTDRLATDTETEENIMHGVERAFNAVATSIEFCECEPYTVMK